MALLSTITNFFTGKNAEKKVRFTAPNSNIDGFEVDCTLNTNVEMVNTISNNPVQSGVPVTDNVIVEPTVIFLEAVISEYDPQLGGLILTGGLISDAIDLISGDSSSENRPTTIYNNLVRLRDLSDGVRFSIAIYPALYDNLVIQSLRFEDSGRNGYGIRFTMGLKQIQIAETSIISSNSQDPTKGAYSPSTAGGFKAPTITGIGGL